VSDTRQLQSGVEYYTDERCHILELLNTPDSAAASIARARVEPGVTTKQHQVAGTVERYVILHGQGIAYIEDRPDSAVGEGDVVLIPAGVTQSITNTGDHDLVFLCICTPRFEWDNYESLE
jgi:mannose-6-phosphate isomerase-like protein (cupin superfamily)